MIESDSTIVFFLKQPTHEYLSIIWFYEMFPYFCYLLHLHLFCCVFGDFCKQLKTVFHHFNLSSTGVIGYALYYYFEQRAL